MENASSENRIVIDRKIGNYQWSTQQRVTNKVFLGQDVGRKVLVAIKILDLNEAKAREKEIKLMSSLKDRENIVNTLEIIQTKTNIILIEEFCNGGDMRMYLRRKNGVLEEPKAKILLNHILLSIQALKEQNIVHRNIKPENFLFKDRYFKLRNFSSMKILSDYEHEIMNDVVGTPIYMSPQILQKSSYTYKSEIWSIGVIYYEMLFGRPPWRAENEAALLNNIKRIPFSVPPQISVSSESLDFICGCLQIDENKRFSWTNILNHPLSKSIGFQSEGIPKIRICMDPDDKAKEILEELKFKATQNLIDFEKLFIKYDTDKSQTLDKSEFEKLIKEISPEMSAIEISALFSRFDINNDFHISFKEVRGILFNQYETDDYNVSKKNFWDFLKFANLVAIIKEFDDDKDGFLSIHEFSKVAARAKLDDANLIEELFKMIDCQNKEKISYEDLVRCVNNYCI